MSEQSKVDALGKQLQGRHNAIRGVLKWACRVSLAIVVLIAVAIFTPAMDSVDTHLAVEDKLEKADYIVVLGGDTERIVEAARLWRDGWAPKVIISAYDEAVIDYAKLGEQYGLPVEAIVFDPHATRTADHPATIAAIAGVDKQKTRLIVVTSLQHTGRAKACFVKQGYQHIIMHAPAWRTCQPGRGWAARARDLGTDIYECLAWGMYKLRGWV